jgi:hypothetical protein
MMMMQGLIYRRRKSNVRKTMEKMKKLLCPHIKFTAQNPKAEIDDFLTIDNKTPR